MSTNDSRTHKSMMNASISLLFYFINIVVGFLLRRYTLHALGGEITGMKSTIQNFLGMLSITELGVGGAIAYALYKPLHNRDITEINEIISVQGWFYRRIALIFALGACTIMAFFPYIFEKADVPMWMTYATFIVILFNSMAGYLINYRSSVLYADQKGYKLTIYTQSVYIGKNFLQAIALLIIKDLNTAYATFLILEFLLSLWGIYILEVVLRREYPWLKPQPGKGKELLHKYQFIITKTKQLFVHQLAGVVLNNSGSAIIYAFTSLTLVSKYDNYMMLALSLNNLSHQALNSINAGIGSLVAEGDIKRIKSFFWELISFKYYLATVLCFGLLMFSHPFVILWVGEEYLLENSILLLISLFIFIGITRTTDAFTTAYGLFDDIWAPATECLLNLVLSISLGYFFGLHGIIIGVITSLILIVKIWKPYYLFHRGFQTSAIEYWKRYIKFPLVSWGILYICFYFSQPLIGSFHSFSKLVIVGILCSILFAIVLFGIYYKMDPSFKNISLRLYQAVIKKILSFLYKKVK